MHGKYSEDITSDMSKKYVVFGGPYVNKSYFKVDDKSQWKEVSFAECLIRGFFGLRCSKCKAAKCNVGIGFCDYCSSTGVLGAHCLKCNAGEAGTYKYMPVKCINARNGTIYISEERDTDKVWYYEIQDSFGKAEREKNLCERRKIVKASRKWTPQREGTVTLGPSYMKVIR